MATGARPITVPDEVGLGNLALDFLDTQRRDRTEWVDLLRTPQDVVTWLAGHVDIGFQRAEVAPSVSEARMLFDEARRLRADVRGLVEGRHRGRIPEWALFGVNRVLAASASAWWLAAEVPSGPTLVELRVGSWPLRRLGPVALAAAHLVTAVPADRLRPCASSRCAAWFVDTSKGGRRRWCSMATCGNREKAALHRAKAARG